LKLTLNKIAREDCLGSIEFPIHYAIGQDIQG